MVLFTSRSSLTWGNLQAFCMVSPPGIYLLSTPNNQLFMSLQRFYNDWILHSLPARKTDGVTTWGLFGVILGSVPALITWNSHNILQGNYFLSVTLKSEGDTQEPHNDMAYLLVHTEDASEAESYSMALVWISPHQARASMMEEALGTLSTCISSGPNWPMFLHSYIRAPIIHPYPRTST